LDIVNWLFGYTVNFLKFLLFIFVISNYGALQAQFNENTFKKIVIEIDGEEIFDVSAITQDHQGYICLGTNLGLIRYNGIEGKKYDIIPGDSFLYVKDEIKPLFIDSIGDIWIGTNSGLNKYNSDCDCLHQYPTIIDDIILTIACINTDGFLVLSVIKVPIKFTFQHLFDAALLDLLKGTGKLVTSLKLFKEIIIK